MRRSLRSPFLLFCIALILVVLTTCSDNPTQSGGDDQDTLISPRSLTVSPTSGPPLTVVSIGGISGAEADDTSIVAFFDGFMAPLFVDTSGEVRTTIPIFYDNSTNWALDSTVISLIIINSSTGDTIGIGEDLFELESLPPAPGTTAQLQTDIGRIADALKKISNSFYSGPGEEEMVTQAFVEALDSLIHGADTTSLAGLTNKLKNENPDGLLLLDALVASTGMNTQTNAYADIFEEMADSLQSIRKSSPSGTTTVTDEELAFRMQLYVVIREYGRTVIGPSASTWSNVTGPIGLLVNIPLVSATGAVLSLIDFVTNKIIVGMLPAKIDYFIVKFAQDTVILGDTTQAEYEIMASNDPPGISVLDFIGQLLNAIGFSPNISAAAKWKELDDLRKVLADVFNYMTGLARSATSAYAGAHPGLNIDPALTSIPDMSWKAAIEQPKFIELTSFTQNILQPDPGGFNWVSLGPDWDEGRVYARTTVDPGAIVIPQVSGFTYSGGAFGEDVARTETHSVWVKPNLVMELTMPPSVEELNFEPMIIVAGYEVPSVNKRNGQAAIDTIWSPDVNLTLNVTGGSVELNSGTTNANGEFTTGVKLSGGSAQVSVTAAGLGDVGSTSSVQGVASGPITDQISIKAVSENYAQAMPLYMRTKVSRVTKAPYGQSASGVTVTWSADGAVLTPVNPTTDGQGYATFGVMMNQGADSALIYAFADAGNGNVAYDTGIVWSYCWPFQNCSYSEGGSGSYTAIGSCTGADLSVSAAVGATSGAEVRTEDPISVIALDSTLWTEECIVYFNVSYSWTATGGVGEGYALEAEIGSPGEFPYVFARVKNLGADVSGSDNIEVPVRGVPLAPWAITTIKGLFRTWALPDPDVPENTGVFNTLNVSITGVSRVTLTDGVTPVEVLCLQTKGGLSY